MISTTTDFMLPIDEGILFLFITLLFFTFLLLLIYVIWPLTNKIDN